MREDASCCRPRLYDKHDPEKPDDVSLIMDALDEIEDDAMEDGDSEVVWHASDLKKRIAASAGGDYESRVDDRENGQKRQEVEQ